MKVWEKIKGREIWNRGKRGKEKRNEERKRRKIAGKNMSKGNYYENDKKKERFI